MKMIKTEKGYFYKKSCIHCGKEFLGNINGKFCSRECSVVYRNKNKSYRLRCKNCGEPFKGYNPRQFYCNECKEILTTRKCEKCGKLFKVSNVNSKQKFCSKACDKKYDFNEDVFNKIETFEQAYWFGFLMGDGPIRYDRERNIRELILGLSEKDHKHILKFAKFLGFSNEKMPLKYDKKRKSYFLRVASKKLVEKLEAQGFPIKNKTDLSYVPEFQDKHLKQAVILGLFDADGSAFISGKLFYLSICGTKNVCDTFADFLNIDKKFIKKIKSTKIYELKIGKQKKDIVQNFYQNLYGNATVFLERKKEVFERFLYTE